MSTTVTDVRCVTVRVALQTPIRFGAWTMTHREFALVRVDASDGSVGLAYCITRDGPVDDIVRRLLRPVLLGRPADEPSDSFDLALSTFPAVLSAGVGMRALSTTDIALWDLHARASNVPVGALVGTQLGSRRLPVTAIVGYPPSISPTEAAAQATDLAARGWRRFKLPCAPTLEQTIERVRAVRSAVPEAWVGLDMNMTLRTLDQVQALDEQVAALRLGWIEDLFLPGDAEQLAQARKRIVTPIAVGDEQGGAYHPQALLAAGSVDVLRVDATTNGGVTRFGLHLRAAAAAGIPVSPHMFPQIHARLIAAFGVDAPIEWGIPGTGVHPMDDALEQPVVEDGTMAPLSDEPGFGRLVNPTWIRSQTHHDPDGALRNLPHQVIAA